MPPASADSPSRSRSDLSIETPRPRTKPPAIRPAPHAVAA